MYLANVYVDPQITGKMLGWAGALFFAFCAVPQVITTFREGHARSMNGLYLGMWLGGAVLSSGGTLLDMGIVPWLLFNYSLSLLCVSVLLRYKLFPRR